MFELDGDQFDLAAIEKFAKDDNKTTEEYISAYGLTEVEPGKLTPSQEEKPGVLAEANATPESPVGVSVLENTSLDLQDPKTRKELDFNYGEEQKYLRDKTIPERVKKKKFTEEQLQDTSFIDEKYRLPSMGEIYSKDKDRLKEIEKLSSIEEAKIIKNIPEEDQQIKMINDLKNQYKSEVDQINKRNATYDKAIEQVSKDTGAIGDITTLFNFGAAASAEATQVINFENDIAGALIDIAKSENIPLEKIAQGRITLSEKEDLINKSKLQVLNTKITSEVKDYSTKYENQVKQLTYLNNQIDILSGGDRVMDPLDSPNRIEQFNKAVNAYNSTLANYKKEGELFNEKIEALQAQYTVQRGDKIIRNFKKSETLDKFNSEVETSPTLNAGATLLNETWKVIKKATVAIPEFSLKLAANVADVITDENQYSMLDSFADQLSVEASRGLGLPQSDKFKIVDEKGDYDFTYGNIVNNIAQMAPFSLYIMLEASRGDFKNSQKLLSSGYNKASKLSGKQLEQLNIVQSAWKATVNDNIKEGETLGLSPIASQAYGFNLALAEGLTSLIAPETAYLKTGIKDVKIGLFNNLKNKATKKAVSDATKQYFSKIPKEIFEEELMAISGDFLRISSGLGTQNNEFTNLVAQKQLVASTVLLSGTLGLPGLSRDYKRSKTLAYNEIIRQSNDVLKSLQADMNNIPKDEKGNPLPEYQEQYDGLRNARIFATDLVRASKVSPENVSSDQLELIVQKQKLIDEKAKLDSSFHIPINEQIAEIDKQIAESKVTIKKAETEQKIVEGTKKLAEKLDVKILDDFESIEEINEYLKGKNINQKLSNEYGTIVQYADGKQEIIINTNEAIKDGVITTPAHELFHAVLFETIKNNPSAQIKLGQALLSELLSIDANQVADSEYIKRLSNYLKDSNISNADSFEEALTLFSEAALNGDIKFQENLFTKIGDYLRQTFAKAGITAKFNTGRDVYNFIKDYNKSILNNKISEKVVATAKKGAIGELTIKDKENKKTDKPIAKQSKNIKQSLDTFVQTPEGTKKYNTKEEFQASEDYIKAYEAITQSNLLDGVIMQGMTDKGITGQAMSNFVDNVKDNLTERFVKNFDPAKNESLFGWLLGKTPIVEKAKLDVIAAYTKKTAKESIENEVDGRTVARSIIDEGPSVEEIVDRSIEQTDRAPKSKLRRELKVDDKIGIEQPLIDKIKVSVEETFKDGLPDVKDKTFRKKLINQYRVKLKAPIAKLIGGGKKYKDFLTQNKETLLTNLPISYWVQIERTMPENERIFSAPVKRLTTQKEIDKANQNGLLYVENEAVGPMLYRKLMPTDKQFLDFYGVSDDVNLGSTKGTRKDELARIIGVTMAADMTPTVIREKAAEGEVTQQEQAKIAEKIQRDPTLKFSKNISKEEREKRNKILIKESNKAFKNTSNFNDFAKQIQTALQNNKITKELSKEGNRAFKGNIYEYYIWEKLNVLNINGLKLATPEWGTGTDIKATYFGKPFDLEVKLSLQDAFGAPTIYFDGEKNEWSFKPENLDQEVFDVVKKKINQKAVDEFLNNMSKLGGYSPGKSKVGFTLRIPEQVYKKNRNKINTEKLYQKIDGKELNNLQSSALNNAIIEYYNKKDINYIIVNNKMYYLKENPLNLPINQLTGDVFIKFRIKPGGKKAGFYNLMATTQFGMNKATSEGTSLKDAFPKIKFSKSLSEDFNEIIENKTGIAADKVYKKAKAEVLGASKGKWKFFIPPGAEDFVGLLYATLGKGKLGDQQMAWYKYNLLNPYTDALNNITRDRVQLAKDFKELKKQLKIVPKNLRKKLPGTQYSQQDAVRVYIWNKQGVDMLTEENGMDKADLDQLIEFVEKDPNLLKFADQLMEITQGEYASPGAKWWDAGSIDADLLKTLSTTRRTKYLEESGWTENVNAIFSKDNLNKLEAAYGKPYRIALENILGRMKSGRNRSFGGDALTSRFTDWISNSIGTIMFLNSRSAVLQTISAVNFINWSDNNVLAAAKAFLNPKQWTKDFMMLMNSPFLVERRNGLKIDVNESEIADLAKTSTNKAKAIMGQLLKAGFLPTQIADSFAIASGGASFYRNRFNSLVKEGYTKEEAEAIAMRDFRETATESQQSSDPSRISQQQAGPLGRIVLAFANTPAQYARLTKKAVLDIKNGRGDLKTNVSKIIYYMVVQNIIFTALQQALFAVAFGNDEEEDEMNKKYIRMANSMSDSILRGLGFAGAAVSVAKNVAIKIAQESDKKSPKFEEAAWKLLEISPPISSKISKFRSAGRQISWNRKEIREKGLSLENPAAMAGAQIIAGATNLPVDRALRKIDNVQNALSEDAEMWQRVALLSGWQDWEIGMKEEKKRTSKVNNKILKEKVKREKVKREKVKR
jgi:phage pi2 protein 07